MSTLVAPSGWAALKAEIVPTLRLAGPVVMGELAWMSMNVVDTLMVGHLSAEALGAVSVGHVLFNAMLMSGCGLLFGLDTVVSQAVGARDMASARNAYVQGLYLAAGMAPVLTALVALGIPAVARLGVHPDVVVEAIPYMQALNWCVVPLLAYVATRRFLQAQSIVVPVMVVLVVANAVNAVTNWVFIYGHLGFPAYGTAGAGWATFASLTFMAAALIAYTIWHERRARGDGPWATSYGLDFTMIRRLVRLGWPVSTQILLEVGVFGAATVMVANFEPVLLAAHQVALNMASVTFMVPLGVSAAAAVRVGQAVGAGDVARARSAGWAALAVGAGFMTTAGLTFVAFPRTILGAFSNDGAVVAAGVPLLLIAAAFQLVDGIQVVATGALRGVGETRAPMVANLVGHWGVGLPIGYGLGFVAGWRAEGVWTGLSAGLAFVAVALLVRWAAAARSEIPALAR